MGTRNLICVYSDGEYKVAQYGQWDGYFEGQGAGVLNFLHNVKLRKFKKYVNRLEFINEDTLLELWKRYGLREDGFIAYEDAKIFGANYPEFSRDTGSKILQIIMDTKGRLELKNSIGDSLFCEYAYVIDLDKYKLEVFIGFNKNPLDDNERFKEFDCTEEEYRPIKKLIEFSLCDLPSTKEFIEMCHKAEDNNEHV